MLGIMRLMGLSWDPSAEKLLTYADQTLPVVGWLNLDCIVRGTDLLPRPLARVLLQLLVPGEQTGEWGWGAALISSRLDALATQLPFAYARFLCCLLHTLCEV
jgi:hypothetical protein